MKLEDLHDCEKCHGKIVSISVDKSGISRCGYCNQVVDYMSFFKKEMKKRCEVDINVD